MSINNAFVMYMVLKDAHGKLKIEDSYLQATEIISAESESLDCKILANQHVKLNTEKQK